MTGYKLPDPIWHGDLPAYSDKQMHTLAAERYAAGLEAGRKVPEGWRLVSIKDTAILTLAEAAEISAALRQTGRDNRLAYAIESRVGRPEHAAAPEYKP